MSKIHEMTEFGQLTEMYAKLEEEFCHTNKITKSALDAGNLAFQEFITLNPSLRPSVFIRQAFIAGYAARLREQLQRTEF